MGNTVRAAVRAAEAGDHSGAFGNPARIVPRARLVQLLDEAVLESRLTLVCAPAGSGKTTLVRHWTAGRRVQGPVVWVGTEGHEKGRRGFWRRVSRGLQDSATQVGFMAAESGPRRLATATRELATSLGPVLLVVDEGAGPPDPVLHRELSQYLDLAGDALHLVFVTRADPVLPLHRYRLAHALSEVRADDLRFTVSEARELFDRADLQLDDTQIDTLQKKTGGWPAGLVFAADFLQGRDDVAQGVRSFAGSDRPVSDFLVKEFLDAQPANVREVLLRSSVVDELPLGLFEELTGAPDGQAALAFLNRANSFLSPTPGDAWSYQYPPLLRDFLRTRLASEHPALVPMLHEVAARWWFRNGSVHEAVRHSAAGGRWDEASRYVVDGLVVGELLNERLDALAIPLEDLPADLDSAPGTVVRAATALRHREGDRARELLADLRASLARGGGTEAVSSEDPDETVLFSLELLESGVAALDNDTPGGLAVVRRAERHLHKLHPSRAARPELWGMLATYRARLQVWDGDVHAARDSLRQVADAARTAREISWEIAAQAEEAVLAAVLGDLDSALELARAVEELAGPDSEDVGRSALAEAWVYSERSLVGSARAALARAEKLLADTDALSLSLLAIVRSRLLHVQGYYSAARAALERTHEAAIRPPRWVVELMEAAHRVHQLSEGARRPGGALEPRGGIDLAGWSGEPPLEIEVTRSILRADAALRDQDEHAALGALLKSLELAAPQRLRRPFAEPPPAVRQLLRGRGDLKVAHRWLNTTESVGPTATDSDVPILPRQRVPADAGPGQRPTGPAPDVAFRAGTVLVEELTAKELEVLGHLADLHTTDEIASGMFISVNTVRTHVRNVLRKLGVDRRNQAVRRAWELGLLADPAERR